MNAVKSNYPGKSNIAISLNANKQFRTSERERNTISTIAEILQIANQRDERNESF